MNPQDMNQQADQLRDIHLPDPVSWWPPAPGWWLLVLLSIVLIVAAWLWRKHRFKRLAYKREALAEFQSIHARYLNDKDNARLLTDLSVLLKRTSITRYGRREAAGLAGEQWLAFLDETGKCQTFTQGPGRALVEQRFSPQPSLNGSELLNATLNWLNKQC